MDVGAGARIVTVVEMQARLVMASGGGVMGSTGRQTAGTGGCPRTGAVRRFCQRTVMVWTPHA